MRYILLVLTLISTFSTIKAQTEVSENVKYSVEITEESGGVSTYKFKVTTIPIKDKDFAIYAEGTDWRSDPDVFISTKSGTEPDLSNDHNDTIAC